MPDMPQSLEAEQAILGAMMYERDAIIEALDVLRPSDFYSTGHALLFETLAQLFAAGKPCDIVEVQAALSNGKLEQVGGAEYLLELTNGAPTAANVRQYAMTVKDRSLRRAMLMLAGEWQREAARVTPEDSAQIVLEKLRHRLDLLENEIPSERLRPIREIMRERWAKIDRATGVSGSKELVIPTGLSNLDTYIGGWRSGKLYYVGAWPGQGKTALLTQVLTHVALIGKHPAAFFSMEMSSEDICDRIFANQARVDAFSLSREEIEGEDMERLIARIGHIEGMPLLIDDTPALELAVLLARIRRAVRRHGVKVVGIDHLHQMVHPRAESLRVGLSASCKAFQALARELRVALIINSQFARPHPGESNPRPNKHDFKESGSIEETADVMLAPWYPGGAHAPRGPAHLMVLKHRQGVSGKSAFCFWEPVHQRFRDLFPGEDAGERKRERSWEDGL